MQENHVIISQGFRVLLEAFAPYIASELRVEFGDDWWNTAVIGTLFDDQKRNLPLSGEWEFYWERLYEPDDFANGTPEGGAPTEAPNNSILSLDSGEGEPEEGDTVG